MLNSRFSSRNSSLALRSLLITSLAATIFTGCKDKEEIKVYRVSKAELESPAPEAATAENQPQVGTQMPAGMPGGMPDMGASNDQPAQITGSAPPDWQAQPLSSMRQASYLVKGDNGAMADISLVILEGPAGGPLDNVNRWLSQLGQPPIDDQKLAQMGQHVKAPLGDVTVVDLEGLPPGGDPAKDGRIVGGMALTGGKTIFFKMKGNAALVESQKDAFIHWISSVQMGEPTAAAAPVAPAMAAVAPAIAPAMSSADSDKAQIKWEVPDGWKTVPASSMRYASFSAAGQNGESAEISVVVLDGEAGGDLQNVNRWRGQIGLDPVADGDLKSLIAPVKAKDADFLTADMKGPKERLLAGWARVDGKSWFFKLTAPDALAGAEKEHFTKFLESVQFHP